MPPISAATTLHGKLSAPATLHGELSAATLKGRINVAAGFPVYTGDTEVTPTAAAQTFPTAGKLMVREFTVNPIPSNWGLITWNGSTLTVS